MPEPKAGFANPPPEEDVAFPNAGLPKLGRPKPPPPGALFRSEVVDSNFGLEELRRRLEICAGALGAPYLVAQKAQTVDVDVSYGN